MFNSKIIGLGKYLPENIVTNHDLSNTIDTSNHSNDRNNSTNRQYAKLFTAMALVIPKNGYILYADNNPDWPGGDHQHHYFDFYKTNLGKPNGNMVEVRDGLANKQFENGFAAYNRTASSQSFDVDGTSYTLGSLEGLLQSN